MVFKQEKTSYTLRPTVSTSDAKMTLLECGSNLKNPFPKEKEGEKSKKKKTKRE